MSDLISFKSLYQWGVNGPVTRLLYDPVIHIPLLISAPGQASRRDVYSLTSCADLIPTLLQQNIGGFASDWQEGKVLPDFGGDKKCDQPVFAVEAKKNRVPARSLMQRWR